MKRAFLLLAIISVNVFQACSSNPYTPEHTCDVFMSCINSQKWDLASEYVFDTMPSLLQLSPLLTKNYQYKKLVITKADFGKDSSMVRMQSVVYYKDGTYLDALFVLQKDSSNQWKIKSI